MRKSYEHEQFHEWGNQAQDWGKLVWRDLGIRSEWLFARVVFDTSHRCLNGSSKQDDRPRAVSQGGVWDWVINLTAGKHLFNMILVLGKERKISALVDSERDPQGMGTHDRAPLCLKTKFHWSKCTWEVKQIKKHFSWYYTWFLSSYIYLKIFKNVFYII